MTEDMLNGINREALLDTLDAIGADPTMAAFRFRARNRWINGGESRTEISGYFGACEDHRREEPFRLVSDEPPVLHGTDRGANPVEYVLHALAGCLTTSLVLHATARGIRIDEIETRFLGELDMRGLLGLDGNVRSGCQRIAVELGIRGDAAPETLAELCRIAQERSPVLDIVRNGVTVTVFPQIEGA